MKRALIVAATLLLGAALIALAGLWWVEAEMETPSARLIEPLIFEVPPGASLRTIAERLHRDGAIAREAPFVWYARYRGLAHRIRAGEYQLATGVTPKEILEQLIAGRVYLHSLTIVEGWTFRDLLQALQTQPAVAGVLEGVDDAEIMARLGRPGLHPEGRFFPDTYHFPRGMSDLELLGVALERMDQELASAWSGRHPDLPLATADELLILASIVEKETALESERATIAGVFVRRLERRMRLQTDPTVIYGLGEEFDGNLRRADLAADTPYNTYTRAGLPPTPISLPGRAALLAAAHPEDGKALYFVATGRPDGSHYFSATLEEHNAAVARYLKALRERGLLR